MIVSQIIQVNNGDIRPTGLWTFLFIIFPFNLSIFVALIAFENVFFFFKTITPLFDNFVILITCLLGIVLI